MARGPARLLVSCVVSADMATVTQSEALPITRRLSARLLFLTIGFVLLAEIAVFTPNMSRFRVRYFNEKLAAAHLVVTALEASQQPVSPLLRDNLLSQGRMLGLSVERPEMPQWTLGPAIPSRIPYVYDLREDGFWTLIFDAFATMLRNDTYAIGVIGLSPANPSVVVEVVIDERPLRDAMLEYAERLSISVFVISIIAAALVYASIQWLAVRPLRRLTAGMTRFQNAPEDPRNIIVPSPRHDEVGVAEQALADMQRELRSALLQKARLAGVGTAVTKISHDLKNILATAMLESDRLDAVADPEIRRLTAGMVRAVDRAVQLSASTLRFAKDGLPHVKKRPLHIAGFLEDVRASIQPAFSSCVVRVSAPEDFVFVGDPDLLLRAFENLIRNAAESGATAIDLIAGTDEGFYTVRVIDNGSGLTQKAQDNLFVPFAGSARSGGSGLGLPIARELLRAQDGDVLLQSTSAQGTCFVVRLPL
jgi:signal transduction histidine kinase